MESLLEDVVKIAKQAGQKILDIYNSNEYDVQVKEDDSPLTKADLAAHHIIVDFLEKNYPQIPCLSEESTGINYQTRKHWKQCFIIDPLDGTKEFLERNGDFTVNIALQENGRILLGVIYLPVSDVTYFAADGLGAFKQQQEQAAEKISVRKLPQKNGKKHITVVASRRHGVDQIRELCRSLASYDLISRGSSLKMCMVAEGNADFSPRLAPTAEWDTAAAQSIVEQAGGSIVQLDFSEMRYNQKESILNPYFLVLGDPSFDWKQEIVIPEIK